MLRILTNSSSSTVELEGFASVQWNEFLALVEDDRAVDSGLSGRVGGNKAQGNGPSPD